MKHRWFSGRMLACHAGGPGSIPGRCNFVKMNDIFMNCECPNNLYEHYDFHYSQYLKQCPKNIVEAPGIDPGTSRMLSERSTI